VLLTTALVFCFVLAYLSSVMGLAPIVRPSPMFGGVPVVSEAVYSAIVIMVIVTTMATPPALKWSLARGERRRTTG